MPDPKPETTDPGGGAFNLLNSRSLHTATPLTNFQGTMLLVVGGYNETGALASAESAWVER